VWVNGVKAFDGPVPRSAVTALQNARLRGDERLVDAAMITVEVPSTPAAVAAAERAWNELTPVRQEGTLSFWEMYATRALEERFPAVGFDGVEEPLPAAAKPIPEQVGLRVRQIDPGVAVAGAGLQKGDLLLSVGGEPVFRGRSGVRGLHGWLLRELRNEPAEYPVVVWRNNAAVTLSTRLKLGPYGAPKPSSPAGGDDDQRRDR
jgi:hypothetical protein